MPEFRPFDYGAAVGQGQQNALMQMQAQQAAQQIREQNAIKQLMSSSNPQAALRAGGFTQQAQDLAMKNAEFQLKGLEYVKKFAPTISSEGQYQSFKENAEQMGFSKPGVLPDKYDDTTKDLLKTIAAGAAQKYRTIAGPSGSILQEDPTTGKLTSVLGRAKKGTSIVLPDGTIVDIEGGAGEGQPLTQKSLNRAQDDIISTQSNLVDLDNIAKNYSDEYLTYKGQFGAAATKYKEKLGIETSEDERRFLANRTKFTQGVEQFFNKYRKEITGAAASVQELEMLKKSMLNADASPTEFRAAYDKFRDVANAQLELKNSLLQQGIKPGTRDFTRLMNEAYLNKGAQHPGGKPIVPSREEYDAMPSGTVYISPINGKRYKKP